MIEYVFRINKKVIDMENPNRNSEETTKVFAELNDMFQDDGNGGFVFKLIEGKQNKAVLEYDEKYLVKNEHQGYNHVTTLELNVPKQVTSMWGKDHITLTITYLGVEGAPQEEQSSNENSTDNENQESNNQDGINKFVNSEN